MYFASNLRSAIAVLFLLVSHTAFALNAHLSYDSDGRKVLNIFHPYNNATSDSLVSRRDDAAGEASPSFAVRMGREYLEMEQDGLTSTLLALRAGETDVTQDLIHLLRGGNGGGADGSGDLQARSDLVETIRQVGEIWTILVPTPMRFLAKAIGAVTLFNMLYTKVRNSPVWPDLKKGYDWTCAHAPRYSGPGGATLRRVCGVRQASLRRALDHCYSGKAGSEWLNYDHFPEYNMCGIAVHLFNHDLDPVFTDLAYDWWVRDALDRFIKEKSVASTTATVWKMSNNGMPAGIIEEIVWDCYMKTFEGEVCA